MEAEEKKKENDSKESQGQDSSAEAGEISDNESKVEDDAYERMKN